MSKPVTEYTSKRQVTPKGYLRFKLPGENKQVLEHNWVWIKCNGDIPTGMQIHHKNEDKQDNRIENLELLDCVSHKRQHGECELKQEVWWKTCTKCREQKPVDRDNWYGTKAPEGKWWPMSICKECHVKEAVISKRSRREKKKALGIPWQLRD